MKTYLLLLLVLVLLAPTAALPTHAETLAADEYNADIAIEWFDLQLELARTTPGFTPPVVSRVLGYTGVALYEAVVPGMPDHQSLAGHLNRLLPLPKPIIGLNYDWRIVANSTLYETTLGLYFNASDESKAKMTALYEKWHSELTSEPAVANRSEVYGTAVAYAILNWARTDGGDEGQLRSFPESYVPPQGPGLWVPTPRKQGDPLPALQPYWGNNRRFMAGLDEQCVLPPPPAYSEDEESDFYAEAFEVYDTVKNITGEQKAIALFWADDAGQTATPPGHSASILNQVLRQERVSLAIAAEAYAKLGIAQADSFIIAWNYKYHYNLLRPITYIQNVIDPNWNRPVVTDPIVTPPFPEYPSGHSVQAGAAAQVLTDQFSAEYAFIDHTHDARGLEPRTFSSFEAFAQEAALSRLYGGIHYRAAIEQGVKLGSCIGSATNALPFKVQP